MHMFKDFQNEIQKQLVIKRVLYKSFNFNKLW